MMESAPVDPDVSVTTAAPPDGAQETEGGTGPPVTDQPLEAGGQRPEGVGRRWQAILFAPVGDGTTRRRGSDAVRLGLAALVVLACWLVALANSDTERSIASALSPAPDGLRWLVSSVWWVASWGLIAVVGVLALVSRRRTLIRDCLISGFGAWVLCVVAGVLFGTDGGRPPDAAFHGFAFSFLVAQVAATVAVATAALPFLSRWLQRTIEAAIVLMALAGVVTGHGLPMAMLASVAIGVGVTAIVRLSLGSPLGLPSAGELLVLLGDLDISATEVVPLPRQEWGAGRFAATLAGTPIDVSFYGRDAADAQLLAKTFRFLLFRSSGPTLTFSRRQQVEHEAYVTLMADRAGARVPRVLAAGPAGPARDALLVTRPPAGRRLSEFPPWTPPDELPADGSVSDGAPAEQPAQQPAEPAPTEPTLDDRALDDIFRQVGIARAAGIAHGSLSVETIVVDDQGRCGLLDLRAASTVSGSDQLDRDLAATLAAVALVVGPERAVAAAVRTLPSDALIAALPHLQRAALDPVSSRSLRGRKAVLNAVREEGARAAGVEVPKLIEPHRISWVSLALVAGTLIGGWALLGVLVNVTKSWSTITGADWGWVVVVFFLAQAAYPSIAVTTIGSVTDPLPYGRAVVLEFADVFVGLAGGSMAVLATRVRFFQQQGYDGTLAVSSGVLASTASWIVKGGLFLVALPLAWSQFHFGQEPDSTGGDSGSSTAHIVWLIVLIVLAVGVVLGIVLAVPRWRRLAAEKLRPKFSEVWGHLRVLSTHPRNLVEIFGGSVAAQILVALALGAALHAFGDHLSLAALIIVLTLGSMLGGISPVPGGMGVVEAGMIFGLTAAGISETDAVAAVFVQRLFTAYLPPIWGWFALVWMRKKEYL
jgi:uncharacterized membrane protein YbhN (UPF0104 family)